MFDIVIRNGRIVDGSGNPWYYGDVGVRGDRIETIDDLSAANATRVIDARGKIVCPGFMDMHALSDIMLLAEPEHEGKIRQGITTELLGNDGLSYAPVSPLLLKETASLSFRPLWQPGNRLELAIGARLPLPLRRQGGRERRLRHSAMRSSTGSHGLAAAISLRARDRGDAGIDRAGDGGRGCGFLNRSFLSPQFLRRHR